MEWLWATQSLINIGHICMLWKTHKEKKATSTTTNVEVRIESSARNSEQLAEMVHSAMKAGQRK